MKKKAVLNSFISIGSYSEFIDQVFLLVRNKFPSFVCFANVHMIVEGYRNPDFQQIINHANLVAADGKPISLFLNYFEKIKQDRICGMDILPDLLKNAALLGKSIYFLGTTEALLAAIVKKAKNEFPALLICGAYSPPFRDLSEKENSEMVEKIKATSPDLVFVSLGCPKQEKWMAENRYKIGACLLGFGQAFRVYAGEEKRLPKWMRNLSLEWMYRLYHEPHRLWRRYLYTNSYFLFLVFKCLAVRFINRLATVHSRLKSPRQTLQKLDE